MNLGSSPSTRSISASFASLEASSLITQVQAVWLCSRIDEICRSNSSIGGSWVAMQIATRSADPSGQRCSAGPGSGPGIPGSSSIVPSSASTCSPPASVSRTVRVTAVLSRTGANGTIAHHSPAATRACDGVIAPVAQDRQRPGRPARAPAEPVDEHGGPGPDPEAAREGVEQPHASVGHRQDAMPVAPELTPAADACPACGREAMVPWREATAADGRTRCELERCPACGSAALRGAAPDPALYESGTYAASRPLLDRLLEPYRRLVDADRLRLLGGVGASDRVLEVGAGRGRLLDALGRRGAKATGVEPSRTLWAAARERGVAVENVPLERAEPQPGAQDLVIIWHVLEHLDRPDAALERIRPWLAPGGRVVISVPNLASLQASIGG